MTIGPRAIPHASLARVVAIGLWCGLAGIASAQIAIEKVGKTAAERAAVVVPPAVNCPQLPGLTSLPYAEAVKRLTTRLFRVRRVEEPSILPRDTVLRQSAERSKDNFCLVTLVVSDGSLVRVPSLAGATREEATGKLRAAQLGISVVERPSETAAGRVFAQNPPPGKEVHRDTTVQVAVALARPAPPPPAENLAVPNVIGMPYGDARVALGSFTVRATQTASSRPRGEVTDQDPRSPASLRRKDPVGVVISDGSLVRVPALSGATREEAEKTLQGSQLAISVVERVSKNADGRVFAQDPPPGKEVQRDSTVRVAVALPPQSAPVKSLAVPNVIGMPYDAALVALRPFPVNSTEVASSRPKGEVIDQDPRAPANRQIQDPVAVRFSDGTLVRVPALAGVTKEEAAKKLKESQLRFAFVEAPSEKSAGRVFEQDPRSDIEVARGSAVRVKIAQPPLVRVPDLIGATRDEAAQRLEAARLVIAADEAPSGEPAGQVFLQVPERDREVRQGSTVKVTIATAATALPAGPVAGTTSGDAKPAGGTPPGEGDTPGRARPAEGPNAKDASTFFGEMPRDLPWYAAAAAIFLAAQVLVLRFMRAKPLRLAPAAPVRVVARLESSFADTRVDGAKPAGPTVRVAVRLDAVETDVKIAEGALP